MKGSLQDMPLIAIILIMTALGIFVTYIILDAFFGSSIIQQYPVAVAVGTEGVASLVILSNSFLFIFITFGIVSVISSFYTETHPVFFVFSLLIFAICVMIVGIFSDVFVELASSQVLLPVASQFVLMVDTISNLMTLSIILGAMIIMALYAKRDDLHIGGGQA